MKERIASKRNIISSVALASASLALTACSGERKEGSWSFSVDCQGQTADVESFSNGLISEVVVHCGDDENSYAPESVELINGEGITIDDDGEVSGELLHIDYDYFEGGFDTKPPVLLSATINDEDATLHFDNLEITGVRVQTP